MTPTLKGRGYRWWKGRGTGGGKLEATLVERSGLHWWEGRGYRRGKVEAHDEDLLLQRRVLTRPCDLKRSHLHFRYKLQMLPRGFNPRIYRNM